MYKIAHITRQVLQRHPTFAEALGHEIVNYSALARLIKEDVEKKKIESVSEEAISIALRRIGKEMKKRIDGDQSLQPIQGVNMRRNISVVSYDRSPNISKKHQKLIEFVDKTDNGFLHFDQGMRDVNFIVSEEVYSKLKELMKDEKELIEFPNCALVSVFHPHKSLEYPGVCSRYFRVLAWEQINLISFFHTYSELTFVVEMHEAAKAHQLVVELAA